MVLPAVQPRARLLAFAGNAGPHDFRQPVDVHRPQAESVLELSSHRVAPWLSSENTQPQRGFLQIDAHPDGDFGNVERVRRCRAKYVGSEMMKQSVWWRNGKAGNAAA